MNTFTFTPENAQIPAERWGWGVLYHDDTELRQFEERDMTFHQFREIEQSNVKLFVMLKLDGSNRIDIPVSDDMQLFHFYRNVKPFYSEDFRRVYVFGWKSKSTGKAYYHFILPDDRVVVSDRDDIDLVKFSV